VTEREVVVVATFGSRVEAQLVVGMLTSYGIRAAMSADDAGGWEPQLQQGSGVRVLVHRDDAARAGELISEAEKDD
jgi:hypothetical protein